LWGGGGAPPPPRPNHAGPPHARIEHRRGGKRRSDRHFMLRVETRWISGCRVWRACRGYRVWRDSEDRDL